MRATAYILRCIACQHISFFADVNEIAPSEVECHLCGGTARLLPEMAEFEVLARR